jgi:hypothetical protein
MSKNLEDKLDRLDERLDSMDKILERNTASLEIHMKRSDMLENYVKDHVVKSELEPIKKHVNQVTWAIRGIFWFLSIVASVAVLLKQLDII